MHAATPAILRKSRMRIRARTDLCRGAISDGRPYRDSYSGPEVHFEGDLPEARFWKFPASRPTGRSPETTRHEASCAPEIASRRQWSSWSDLGHAAIDDQFDAGDIATFVRSEKRHHFGNFVQGSGATEGYIAHGTVCVLFDLFFRHP